MILLKGVKELEALRATALVKRNGFAEYESVYLAMRQAEIDAGIVS
jgi:hypothetical protein